MSDVKESGTNGSGLPVPAKYAGRAITMAVLATISGLTSATFFVVVQQIAIGQLRASATVLTILGVLYIIAIGLGILAAQVTLRATYAFAAELRLSLARRVAASPLEAIERQGVARIMGNLLEDVNLLTSLIESIPVFCQNAVIVVGILSFLVWIDWGLGVTVMSFAVVAAVCYMLAGRKFRDMIWALRKESSGIRVQATNLVLGIKELKLNRSRREAFFEQDYTKALLEHRDKAVEAASMLSIMQSTFRASALLGVLIVVIYSITANQGQSFHIQGLLILLFAVGPLGMVLNAAPNWSEIRRTYRGIIRLADELGDQESMVPALDDRQADTARIRSWSSIEMSDVVFEYDDPESPSNGFTLGPISLSLEPASIVHVIGPNGSGKTTFAKLLAGLYTPKSGAIKVDGQRVTPDTIQGYRQYISAVFLDSHLFDRLIPADTITDDSIEDFLVRLDMSSKVSVRNNTLDRTKFSRGQMRRLALLDTFVQDRPVVILDEWAAEQDPTFREYFYRSLLPWFRERGKCVVVVSHDHTYNDVADKIVRLGDGAIAEMTGHDDARSPGAVNQSAGG